MIFKKKKIGAKLYTLPVVPVRDIVVFPNTIVPLFVGRKQSIRAIDTAIEQNTDLFVITQNHLNFNEDVDTDSLQRLGVICKIVQSMKLPDGTIKITLDCICRAKAEVYKNGSYVQAHLTIPANEVGDADKNKFLMNNIKMMLFEYISRHENISNEVLHNMEHISQPDSFADVVASRLDEDINTKIDLLRTINLTDRLEKIQKLIYSDEMSAKIQKQIKKQTDKNIAKSNREYYLREQMNTIKKELGEKDNPNDISEKYKKRMEEKKLPKNIETKVLEEINKLKYLGSMSSEAGVIRGYLDVLLELPWNEKSELKQDIKEAEKFLNSSHYGMEKAKERILESIAVQIKMGEPPKRTILCLHGAPGVGKTSLAEAMAKATGREFVKIALGGVGDEAEIRGHRKTYLGSMPGKIIMAMKQAKTTNPLILLDEIDKIVSDHRGDPSAALLEVLDYQQNNKFVDHYLEVEYDLSKVMFVATANSLKIAHPLLDRLELIKVPSYLENEKFNIAKNYIIPRQLKENGLVEKELTIKDDAIFDIIKYYTREAGVRDLERKIAKICRKAVIETLKTKKSVLVSSKNLKDYLGVKKYEHTIIERKDFVGVVNGLAYTEVGGDILMIEAVKIPNGKGDIKYTGELGNVMKESIQTAFSLVKSKSEDFGIDPSIFSKYDIHIHVPDGATPKDGPSAGITMVTALVSLLKKHSVSKYLAMTGEISLRGAVLPIGGLREKLTSAVRSGVKVVIIPKENEKDLEEIPQDVLKKLVIHPCDRIEQVIKIVFETKINDEVVKNKKNDDEKKNKNAKLVSSNKKTTDVKNNKNNLKKKKVVEEMKGVNIGTIESLEKKNDILDKIDR